MERGDLIERIEKLEPSGLELLGCESIKRLTGDFSEELVRLLVSKGTTNYAQTCILWTIEKAWVATCGEQKPDYMKDIRLDLELGEMIDCPALGAYLTVRLVGGMTDIRPIDISDTKAKGEGGIVHDDQRPEEGCEMNIIKRIETLEARNKELEAENIRLRKEREDEQDEEPDTEEVKTDGRKFYDKVCFELFIELLEKAGCDLNDTGNKTRAGELWEKMTGKPGEPLRKYCSPRNYNNQYTRNDIKQLKTMLEEMGVEGLKVQQES